MSVRAFGIALVVWIAAAMPGKASDIQRQIADGVTTALMSEGKRTDGILRFVTAISSSNALQPIS